MELTDGPHKNPAPLWRIEMMREFKVKRLYPEGESSRTLDGKLNRLILISLALSLQAPVERQTHADRVWELGPVASNHLSDLTARVNTTLRRLLEPKDDGIARKSVIEAPGKVQLFLNTQLVVTDVQEFLDACQIAAEERDAVSRAKLLKDAMRLYRGELLPGFTEPWIAEKREFLQRKSDDLKRQLAELNDILEVQESRTQSRPVETDGPTEQAPGATPLSQESEPASPANAPASCEVPQSNPCEIIIEETIVFNGVKAPAPAPTNPKDTGHDGWPVEPVLEVGGAQVTSRETLSDTGAATTRQEIKDTETDDKGDIDLPRGESGTTSNEVSDEPPSRALTDFGAAFSTPLAPVADGKTGRFRPRKSISRGRLVRNVLFFFVFASIVRVGGPALLYSFGRAQWNERSAKSLRRSQQIFEVLTFINPMSSSFHSALADAVGLRWYYGFLKPSLAAGPAMAEATRARDLAKADHDEHELAQADTSVAWVEMLEWKWEQSEKDFDTANDLDEDYATGWQWHSLLLMIRGDELLAHHAITVAQVKEPTAIMSKSLAQRFYFSRDFADTIKFGEPTARDHPSDVLSRLWLGLAWEQLGVKDQALSWLEEAGNLSDHLDMNVMGAIAHARATFGDTIGAQKILQQMLQRSKSTYVSSYDKALAYVGLSNKDLALRSLEQGSEEQDGQMILIGLDPRFDCLHNDTRFKGLLHRMHLQPSKSRSPDMGNHPAPSTL